MPTIIDINLLLEDWVYVAIPLSEMIHTARATDGQQIFFLSEIHPHL